MMLLCECKPMINFPNKPHSIDEKLWAFIPANKNKTWIYLIDSKCGIDGSCLKSQNGFKITSQVSKYSMELFLLSVQNHLSALLPCTDFYHKFC
jgi:hypothetical protein